MARPQASERAEPSAAAPRTAQEINALRPFDGLPIRPMRPFVLKAGGDDRQRALQCLAQAVYYEAGREPLKGQQAVAQVVLNRVRHPAYPKSVCGVVFENTSQSGGCQFTFTCNGALRAAPEPALWSQSMAVAKRALAGFVDKEVGSATHYHADYVVPYWAPSLVKMTQVGAHIFYRWTGPWGEPPAFTGRYAGHEADLAPQLAGADPPVEARKVTLDVAGVVRTYTVADAEAAGGQRSRVQGVLQPVRRQPTPDEVKRINDSLARIDASATAGPPKVDLPAPGA